MRDKHFSKKPRFTGESGQTMLLVLLALSLFLLGVVGFAVDMGYLWFHRQQAQTAADAACTAGVMDMLSGATGGTPSSGFTVGTAFNCSSASTASPCVYAKKNGIDATAGLVAGQASSEVAVTFPSSVTGLPACTSGTGAPPICDASSYTAHPFMQVNVTDRVPTFFSGMISGSRAIDVGAQATCAVVFSSAPIPLLVLDPRNETSVSNNGNFQIAIEGGPQRSIQVNASSSSAVSISGVSGNFDLSHGGPNFTGSDFAVVGTEASTNYTAGTTGQWVSPTGALSDPFAQIPAPSVPGAPVRPSDLTALQCPTIPCHVTPATLPNNHGCQDATNGCELYTPGLYTTVNAIQTFKKVVLFDPCIYYMQSDLAANTQTCIRPGTGTGDGSGGSMFYFSGTHTLSVSANSGTYGICGTTTKVPLSVVKCINSGPGTTTLPADVVAAGGLSGNVLLGPCQAPTGGGYNYGDPLGVDDPVGEQRGMLFFQDRSANLAAAGNQPNWGGGGSFGLAGNLYFHYCNSSDGAGLGSNCNAATAYTDNVGLQGGACSSTFVVGDIVTDKLNMGGNPCIEMDLNPAALFYVLKASLIQ